MRIGFGWDFDFVQNLVDCLAQLVELVAVFLVLDFKVDDIPLVVLLGFPLLTEEVGRMLYAVLVDLGFGAWLACDVWVAEKVHWSEVVFCFLLLFRVSSLID